MSKGFSMDLNAIKSQITQQLDVNGLLFLVKTEDHFSDDLLVKKLIDTSLFASKGLKRDLSELEAFKNEVQGLKGNYLIEIPKITDEVLVHLSEQVGSQKNETSAKVVYLLPNQITRRFFDISERESFISSCLFISELGAGLVSEVLKERLATIFDKQLTAELSDFFLTSRQTKSMRLGKLLFFAQTFKNELIKGGSQAFDESSLVQFLDNIGAKFLSVATVQVSLENVQSFFRAFIFQQGTSAMPIELTRSEVQALSLLSTDQLDFLLQLATSEQYQILLKRGEAEGYRLFIPEYSKEWKDLKSWIANEEIAFKQYKVFEEIAQEYFKGTGFLLGKERLDQALILKEEIFTTYPWEVKYKVDKELFSSFLLLSQNFHEELIKTQQKKRASLLRNSVRISIAVSIAFLLSSFTALLAYLERNSAVIQQELAIKSKEEAVVAQRQAEKERLEAVSARENEQSALKVAQEERLLAISAQKDAEVQRGNAVESLNAAKLAEKEASDAKDVALKNAKLANDATIEAKINFEKSEKLRNQQEARATALEALGYFANRDFARGIDLVKDAYQKNLSNGGFPLQSDIFNALLNGLNSSKVAAMDMDLEFPAKLLALSKNKDKLAVYTINGELRMYATQPSLTEKAVIKTGYIKSFEFLSDTEIIGTDIKGALFSIDLTSATISDLTTKLPVSQIKGFFKAFGSANIWIAKLTDGSTGFYQFDESKGFVSLKDDKTKLAGTELNKPVFWAEGNEFYRTSLASGTPELVVKASSIIHSATWSTTHSRWMLGLENGNIWSVDPTKQKTTDSFTIHSSKVSQLVTMPYAHGTELMLSTGFDGGLIFFVFDKNIPLSASASSRIKFQGHRSWITGFTIDEKKKIAYSISNDRTIKVWPLEINELLQK
jgi:hypothetical protein